MAKSKREIEEIVEERGFSLIDCSEYKNLQSFIKVACGNGHSLLVQLSALRKASFRCPSCEGESTVGFDKEDLVIPEKGINTLRLIAFDQSSKVIGMSIYDNNKLVYYTYITVRGETDERLRKIFYYIHDHIIPTFEPDYLAFEDIQLQGKDFNNIVTFKTLAEVFGLCKVAALDHQIKYVAVQNNVWQAHFGIKGKGRQEQKQSVVDTVKSYYGIDVTDDVADAILIGRYVMEKHVKYSDF